MKRGPKPKGQVALVWSPEFAYAIGLLVADGCLSKDGRHIDFTSKDEEQVLLFKKCLGLKTKVSPKRSGSGGIAYHTQFGDVIFYRFLMGIGLTQAKSKTLGKLSIPPKHFIDFLRGYFDGDGCSFSYNDSVFKNSFRFYISFASASPLFLTWLRKEILATIGIKGYINKYSTREYLQLKYSKREAIVLSCRMYYRTGVPHLRRKRKKIYDALRIIESRPGGEIGRRATFRS